MKKLIFIMLLAATANGAVIGAKVKTRDSTSYADFGAYITATGTDTVSPYFAKSNLVISGKDTCPANIDLAALLNGVKIYGSTGSSVDTLWIGKMSADPLRQIFDTSLTVRFLSGAVPHVRSVWFGTTALASACYAAMSASSGKTFVKDSVAYKKITVDTLTVTDSIQANRIKASWDVQATNMYSTNGYYMTYNQAFVPHVQQVSLQDTALGTYSNLYVKNLSTIGGKVTADSLSSRVIKVDTIKPYLNTDTVFIKGDMRVQGWAYIPFGVKTPQIYGDPATENSTIVLSPRARVNSLIVDTVKTEVLENRLSIGDLTDTLLLNGDVRIDTLKAKKIIADTILPTGTKTVLKSPDMQGIGYFDSLYGHFLSAYFYAGDRIYLTDSIRVKCVKTDSVLGGRVLTYYIQADSFSNAYGQIQYTGGGNNETIYGTYSQVTSFNVDGVYSNMTVKSANDSIGITRAGVYRLHYSMHCYPNTGANGLEWDAAILRNDVANESSHSGQYAANINEMFTMEGECLVRCSVGDGVKLAIKHNGSGGKTLTVEYCTINAHYIGN